MDKKSRHIEELTPEVIQAYHSGKLTSSEMHQVELLMLENSFYNEGLEGLQSLDSTTFKSDIKELSKRIDKATEKKKAIFWTIYTKVAAAVLLFMTFTALFYFSRQATFPSKELSKLENSQRQDSSSIDTESNEDIDTNSIKAKARPSVTQIKALESEEKQEKRLELESTTIAEFEAEPVTPLKIETSPQANIAKLEPPISAFNPAAQYFNKPKDTISKEFSGRKVEEDNIWPDNTNALRSQRAKVETKQLQGFAQVENSINGIITGADDKLPLPAVTIFLKGTTNGTQSNTNGRFSLDNVIPKSILVIRYLGYVTQEVEIGSQREFKIELQPDVTSLSEVVVTGVATSTDSQKLPFTISGVEVEAIDSTSFNKSTSYSSAKPEIGYPKFNRYLRKNLKYPESAREKKIRGRVIVQFRVSETGTLSNFQIIKSLGHGCDEEAIRLIKEGPKWLPKTEGPLKRPVSSTVKVKIRFKP